MENTARFTVNFSHSSSASPTVVEITNNISEAMQIIEAYREEWEGWVKAENWIGSRTVEFDEEKRQVLFTQYRKGDHNNHSCFAWVDDERTLQEGFIRQPSWLTRI